MTPTLFHQYVYLRLNRGAPPAAEGEWWALKPWLEFLDRIRPVPTDNGGTRPNRDTIESWQNYLRQFPNSPKSEAASLRLLRLKVRKICPIPQVEAFHFPASPILGGYKRMTRPSFMAGRELEALASALEAHEKRFPKGRYQADLALLRAAISADIGDYETALSNLASILSDASHPELRMDAALQLSDCGLRLLDLNERAAVAAAFRKTPAAMPYLKNLVHGDTCLFRLRPLMAWLEAE